MKTIPYDEAVPNAEARFPSVGPGCPDARECRVILHLIDKHRPKTYLEVGINAGTTLERVASRFPAMWCIGVDPGDTVPVAERLAVQIPEYLPASEVGKMARHLPNVEVIMAKYEDCVTPPKADFVFIDAEHTYKGVTINSCDALRGGAKCIVWHDVFQPATPEVAPAVAAFEDATGQQAFHVAGTTVAYMEVA